MKTFENFVLSGKGLSTLLPGGNFGKGKNDNSDCIQGDVLLDRHCIHVVIKKTPGEGMNSGWKTISILQGKAYDNTLIDLDDYDKISDIKTFLMDNPEYAPIILNTRYKYGYYNTYINKLKKDEDISALLDGEELGLI